MSSHGDLSALRIDRERTDERSSGSGWFVVFAVILVLAGAGTAAWQFVPKALPVTTAQVIVTGGAVGPPSSGLSAAGYVVARRSSEVAPSVPGRVAKVLVEEGDPVTEGQLVALLEADDLDVQLRAARAQLAQVEAQLPAAERTLNRARSLQEGAAGTAVETERAEDALVVLQAQHEAAKAQVAVSEANRENVEVRAPFAGTVLRKRVEVGEFVSPGSFGSGGSATGIVELADLASLEVDADVNEVYISRVKAGMDAKVVLDAAPDHPYAARVRTIVPTADRQKATVRVRVALLDTDAQVMPEMGAKVTFQESVDQERTAEPRRVLLPKDAGQGDGPSVTVWVVDGGKVTRRSVDVDGEHQGQWIVKAGLSGGEVVVRTPPPGLIDGTTVKTGG
jgi:RND family efflux transporter MFP subunit